MKKTFAVQILGADNGSGAFERRGDLGFKTVDGDGGSTYGMGSGFERRLSNRIAHALLAEINDGDGNVNVYDESVAKIGNHFVVSFTLNQEGAAGERHFVFVATEAS